MDLRDRAEHQAFREEVRQFLDENKHQAPSVSAFTLRMRPRNLSEDVRAWQGLLIDRGLTSRTIPKAYGGFGAEPDILKSRIIADEFYAADTVQGLRNMSISMLVPTMLEHGTEAQKQRYIKPSIRSE